MMEQKTSLVQNDDFGNSTKARLFKLFPAPTTMNFSSENKFGIHYVRNGADADAANQKPQPSACCEMRCREELTL